MLGSWRKQLSTADSEALAPRRRGPKPDAAARQIKHLNRDNARLRRRLERAEIIIDAQKKLCVALGLRPRTRRARTSDGRRQRAGPSGWHASGLQSARVQPRVTDRHYGAGDDRRNGATKSGLERASQRPKNYPICGYLQWPICALAERPSDRGWIFLR